MRNQSIGRLIRREIHFSASRGAENHRVRDASMFETYIEIISDRTRNCTRYSFHDIVEEKYFRPYCIAERNGGKKTTKERTDGLRKDRGTFFFSRCRASRWKREIDTTNHRVRDSVNPTNVGLWLFSRFSYRFQAKVWQSSTFDKPERNLRSTFSRLLELRH